jgi:hypothetical protein
VRLPDALSSSRLEASEDNCRSALTAMVDGFVARLNITEGKITSNFPEVQQKKQFTDFSDIRNGSRSER